jgi:hypothetical protein
MIKETSTNPQKLLIHIPEHKKDFMAPIVNLIIDKVIGEIVSKEHSIVENKKDINRMK